MKLGSGDFLGTRSLEVTRGRGYELTAGNWRGKEVWVASDDSGDGPGSLATTPSRSSITASAEQTNGFFLVTDENPPLPDSSARLPRPSMRRCRGCSL